MNGFEFLLKGGPMMYVLLPLSVIAIVVVIERFVWLNHERRETNRILGILNKGAMGEISPAEIRIALENFGKCDSILGNILTLFIDNRYPEGKLESLVDAAALTEEKRLKDRIWILDTMITMAPLLGLLGTIMGIISSFHVMSISGLGKPAQITGGVAQALIATATGLVIAIVSLGFYNFLNSVIREIRGLIESSVCLLFFLRERLRAASGKERVVSTVDSAENPLNNPSIFSQMNESLQV